MNVTLPSIALLFFMSLSPAFPQSREPSSTAGPTVEVREHAIYVPYSGSWRTLRVYTPPSYGQGNKRYPVIYALDGQNLFDRRTSFAGEWRMDETLDSLAGVGHPEAIVVGIDNHSAFRTQEYNLFNHERYGPGLGGAFLDFVAGDLKDYIDQEYRTLSGRENTAIIGSSMGGLMAFAAAMKFPHVFSRAGVYSPSFWISEEYFDLPKQSPGYENTRIYMTVGEDEGPVMTPPFQRMKDSLTPHMIPGRLQTRIIPGGKHNEPTWAAEFPGTFTWWFPKGK